MHDLTTDKMLSALGWHARELAGAIIGCDGHGRAEIGFERNAKTWYLPAKFDVRFNSFSDAVKAAYDSTLNKAEPTIVKPTAAEVIARYDLLVKQIAMLKDERDSLLRKVAFPWQPDRKGHVRNGLCNTICCNVWPIDGRWSWTLDGNEWHPAEPNTPEGAMECADAKLIADGTLFA